jgi:quercetin dioxygenase-like cupin family protein
MELPPHIHTRESEYFRSLEIAVTTVVEGDLHGLSPGEDITVNPSEEHGFRNDTDEFVALYSEL